MTTIRMSAEEPSESQSSRFETGRVKEVLRQNIRIGAKSESTFRNGLIKHLRKLRDPKFVLDNIGIVIPKQRIENSIRIIKEWPESIPAPDMNEENGEIHFYLYDEDGFCVAGLELYGNENKCAYSVGFNGRESMGEFDVNSSDKRKNFFKLLKKCLV